MICRVVHCPTVSSLEHFLATWHFTAVREGHVRLHVIPHVVPRTHCLSTQSAAELGDQAILLFLYHAVDHSVQI